MEKPKGILLVAKQSLWLIKLRWIAIAGVILVIAFSYVFELNVYYSGLLGVLIALVLHNVFSTIYLKYIRKGSSLLKKARIKRNITNQILIDLILLSVLIYFSGGIENPFILFYIFHIVIASIILKRSTSYLIASLSTIMLGAQIFIEQYNILPHYSLDIINYSTLNFSFKFIVLIVFVLTVYVLVYLVSNISYQLREKEKALLDLNRNLEDLNLDLERKDAIKNEYVLRVTHDIKGHLAAIQTNLSVLQLEIAGGLNEKQKTFTDIAYSRTVKLTDFVKELLKLTHIKLQNNSESANYNLNRVIESSIASVKENAKAKSISVKEKIDNNLNSFGSSFSIEEVITNLGFSINYFLNNIHLT